MIRIHAALLPIVASLVIAGCGPPTLMPTPVAFDGGVDPLAPGDQETTTRVFIVTDRTPSGNEDDPAAFYSNDRDYGLRVGVATVDLAQGMTWDELHAESLRAKRHR